MSTALTKKAWTASLVVFALTFVAAVVVFGLQWPWFGSSKRAK